MTANTFGSSHGSCSKASFPTASSPSPATCVCARVHTQATHMEKFSVSGTEGEVRNLSGDFDIPLPLSPGTQKGSFLPWGTLELPREWERGFSSHSPHTLARLPQPHQ